MQYEGNGITCAYPAPQGWDGSTVILTPPGGASYQAAEGTAYTVDDGGAGITFTTPPPEGCRIAFDAVQVEQVGRVATVFYPDGTIRTLDADPWELLEAAAKEREAARQERAELRAYISTAGAEIRALAEQAKADFDSRLLNYAARAEEAIAGAAAAARADVSAQVENDIEELRGIQGAVFAARSMALSAANDAEGAALTSAAEAAAAAADDVHDCCGEAIAAADKVAIWRKDCEIFAHEAQNAAADAGRAVTANATAQMEVALDEIRAIRGRLERDVIQEQDRERRVRDRELAEMARIQNETIRAVRRLEAIEDGCRVLLMETQHAEDRVRAAAERVSAFESTWNNHIRRDFDRRRAAQEREREAKTDGYDG